MRVLLSTIVLLLSPIAADAHDYVTRDGKRITWYSGNGCCNGTDCRPIKSRKGFDKEGNLIVVTDDDITITIPKDLVRKQSGDLGEHVCAESIPSNAPGKAHCFFVPLEANMTRRPLFARLDLERDLAANICKTN